MRRDLIACDTRPPQLLLRLTLLLIGSARASYKTAEELTKTILLNGYQHASKTQETNFVMWNRTDWLAARFEHSPTLICTMMKVGSSTVKDVGFQPLDRSEAAAALLDPRTTRAIILRNPVDRFVSWYTDKIMNGEPHMVQQYNLMLLRDAGHKKHPITSYMRAIHARPNMAWELEYHLAPMTRMCHLPFLAYDVIGRLDRLDDFWRDLDKAGASLPSDLLDRAAAQTHINQKKRHALPDEYCEIERLARVVYAQDFAWIRRQAGALTRDFDCSPICPNVTEKTCGRTPNRTRS